MLLIAYTYETDYFDMTEEVLFWPMPFPFMLKEDALKNLLTYFKNHNTAQILIPQLIYHLDMLEEEILETQIITDITSNLNLELLSPQSI